MRQPRPYQRLRGLKEKFCQRWLPLLLAIVVSVAVLGLWQQLRGHEQLHMQKLVQQEATAIELELNRELTNRILALQRMASRWQASGGTPKALWEMDAANFVKDFHGYQAVEWVDASFHVRWVVPLKRNETAQNLDLNQEPRRQVTLSVARDLRQVVLTRTITLAQGEAGFFAAVPLFVPDQTRVPARDRFDGFILGVFRFQALFDSILRASPRYQIQIYDHNGLIYSQGEPLTHLQPKTIIIHAYGADWQVRVFPTPALIAEAQTPLPTMVLGSGLVGAWTLALIVYLSQRSERYVQQARKINQQLQEKIVEQQQIDRALRESEARFQSFMNHSPAAAWITDANGKILYLSQTYFQMFQVPNDNFIGKTIFQLFTAEVAQPLLENIQTVARTKQAIQAIEIAPRQDGTLGDFLVYKFPIPESSGQTLIGGVAIDVTQQHQAEAALQLSQERLQLALEASGDGLWDLDLQLEKPITAVVIKRYWATTETRLTSICKAGSRQSILTIAPGYWNASMPICRIARLNMRWIIAFAVSQEIGSGLWITARLSPVTYRVNRYG